MNDKMKILVVGKCFAWYKNIISLTRPDPRVITFAGPTKSHKSSFSSFVSGLRESFDAWSPGPTLGCRIFENERIGVELWDVSGDVSAEATWPAIRKGTDGVIVIYDPDVPGNAKEADLWYNWFVTQAGVNKDCAAVVALSASGTTVGSPPPSVEGTPIDAMQLSTEEGGPMAKKLVEKLAARIAKRQGR